MLSMNRRSLPANIFRFRLLLFLLVVFIVLVEGADAIISVESTDELCTRAGSGEMIIHEKGHLFPTKAVYVDQMVEFLKTSLK